MATLKILTIDELERNKSRQESYSDDDDMEHEVCQKLIRLSFAKIVSSKNTRGGAKLHRNLLILHLLQKARTNHRRSSSESPPPVSEREERSSLTTSASEPAKFDDVDMDEEEEKAEGESNSTSSTARPLMADILSQAADEITAEDDDDDDQSLTFAPLQLVFATDAVTDRQLTGEDGPAAAVVVPELHDMDADAGLDNHHANGRFLSCVISTGSDYNDSETNDDNDQSSSSASSSSDEDSNSLEKDDCHRRKQRKRKPSVNHWTANKKCCTELVSGQLNGLISVFSHGLTVKKSNVSSIGSDQLVPSVAASTAASGASLVSRSLSCPSLVRLACNPLICK